MHYIDQVDISGKKLLIRADLDVPLDENSQITDDQRLQAALPTLRYALSQNASVVLCGHLGRPKGKVVPALSLKTVAERLATLLDQEVRFSADSVGSNAKECSSTLKGGEICLLENLRFEAGEEANDPSFAEQLADYAEVYVNNAFATAHRAHASTAGVARFFQIRLAGLTIKAELEYFDRALREPKRPLLVIFGGAKISTKMKALLEVSRIADRIVVGGAMANTFLAAQGHDVQESLFEPSEIETALEADRQIRANECELFLPVDLVISAECKPGAATSICAVDAIPPGQAALDIGPQSIIRFDEVIKTSESIVWNGPMGCFEIEEFRAGTFGIVDSLVASSALRVVGGGDTDLALHLRNAVEKVDFVSTGGGAFLKLLEGAELPALVALDQ